MTLRQTFLYEGFGLYLGIEAIRRLRIHVFFSLVAKKVVYCNPCRGTDNQQSGEDKERENQVSFATIFIT